MQLDIFKSIASYLLQNESVSIQGLGSFYLENVNVDFEKDSQILHPPRKTIVFDSSDTGSSQFFSYLIEKLDISYDEVKVKLKSFVNELNQTLSSGETVTFPGMGTFLKNNDKLTFRPFSTNFHPDYLYYPSIPLRPITVKKTVKAENLEPIEKIGRVSAIHKENATVLKEETAASVRKESMMEEKNYQPNQHYYEKEKGIFSAIGWPLFWLVALGLLFLFLMKSGCHALSEGKQAATEVLGDVTDTAGNVIDQATGAVTDNTDSDGDTYTGKYSDVLTNEIIDKGCVIIVGAFKKSRNALRMRERIIAKGYQPYDETHNGLNRVGLIFECLDEDLVDFLQEIRREIEPKAWYRIPGFEVAYEN